MNEYELWQSTAQYLVAKPFSFGKHWSFNFFDDPKRLGFVLSRYKFAAKMACKKGSVLELGCSDGIGVAILAEHMERYVGVDLDQPAIASAMQNFTEEKYQFFYDDFMGKYYGQFNAVISLDVVEHILPEFEEQYFATVHHNLSDDGICVIGTPNKTSEQYASETSRLGHVNLFTQERLFNTLQRYFYHVFPFGMNDEHMHTGFAPMAHYIFCLACGKKRG